MNYKIAQLLLTPGSRNESFSDIFIAQPSVEKEELAGKLFILIQIESKKAPDIKVANFLMENLNTNYYQNEKMILRERVKTVKVDHIFESALAKTNKLLFDYLKSEKIKFNFSQFNATVGIIYNNDILFANAGKNKTFLIYKNKDSSYKKKYYITNISKQKDDYSQNQNSHKLFSTVISGSIPKYGYFFITNEALPEYVSNTQIIDVITNLPPASAAEQIKNELSKIKHYVPFLGIIIKNTLGAEKELNVAEALPASTSESISKLNIVEDRTEKLLTPGGYVNLKKWLAVFFGKIFRIKPKAEKSNLSGGGNFIREKIFFKARANQRILNKIWLEIKNASLFIFSVFISIFKFFTDKNKILAFIIKIKNIPFAVKAYFNNLFIRFKTLSKNNKILIGLALLFLILFIQGLFYSNIKNKNADRQENFLTISAPIEQKLNQAEANLLYNNEAGAKNLLIEIDGLINQLPQQTEEEKNQLQIYEKKYNTIAEKIRHIVIIENPRELADFSKLNQDANPENITISSAADKIYAGDSTQKKIYSVGLKDKTATILNKNLPNVKTFIFPSSSTDGIISYFNSDSIIQLNVKKEELISIPVKLTDNLENIVSISIFNSKLYILNKKDSQIYTYKKTSMGYSDPVPWIKDKTDLSGARNMNIDGKIYVLTQNGDIIKYLRGGKENFVLDAVDPVIENAKKAIIDQDLKYIYILEPDKQRLIIFNNEGKFVLQYQSDKLNNLKDFLVDEKKKLIYILNGSIVYEFDATHLK